LFFIADASVSDLVASIDLEDFYSTSQPRHSCTLHPNSAAHTLEAPATATRP